MLRRAVRVLGGVRASSRVGASWQVSRWSMSARGVSSAASIRSVRQRALAELDGQGGEEEWSRPVRVRGWVRSARHQKKLSFLHVGDGSELHGLQVVVDVADEDGKRRLSEVGTGCSVEVDGRLVRGRGRAAGQEVEVHCEDAGLRLVGACEGTEYPLQKKYHSLEFLRTQGHLRARSNTIGAAMRVRSTAFQALHSFMQAQGLLAVQTPIITPLDCEGAGELFSVGPSDFFESQAYLTVSGQLYGEMCAASLSSVYTFGPTFRAENSNTHRHLSEFWMLEPEVAYASLEDTMDLAEGCVKHALEQVLSERADDMAFFDDKVHKGVVDTVRGAVEQPFERITYTEAVEILDKCGESFELPHAWGSALHAEHERYLADVHFGKPVFVTDYPKAIKPFYMRASDVQPPQGETVACIDLLVPRVGEIVGGSVREHDYDKLRANMSEHGLDLAQYQWYLDLRRFGSVPHAGFGLGFERLVQFATGLHNVRDVVMVPRVPGPIGI